MSRRHRRRRGSTAGQLVSDTAFIANRLPWPWQLAFGLFLFASFYWGVPAVIAWQLESIENKVVRGMLEGAFGRRGHWSELLGIALGLTCVFFAGWNAWTRYRFGREGERNTGLVARVLARWID